jgi:hypothetical protein
VIELDIVAAHWEIALDAADRALVVCAEAPIRAQVAGRRHDLVIERRQTSELLRSLAG